MSILLPTDRNVIIVIGSILGTVVLLILFYNLWKRIRLPKQPLPPKGPLAFERSQTVPDTPTTNFTRLPARSRSLIGLQDIHHHHLPSSSHSFININPSTVDEPIASSPTQLTGTDQSSSSLELAMYTSPMILQDQKKLPRKPSTRSIATSSIKSRADSSHSRASYGASFRGVPHRQRMSIVLPRPLAPLHQSPPDSNFLNEHARE